MVHFRFVHLLPLQTNSLAIRKLVRGDVTKLFQMSQEESMRRWIPSQVYRDVAHASAVLDYLISQYATANPRAVPVVLGIELCATRELIGHVGLSPVLDSVEIGYAIEERQQRKGLATEAVKAAALWAVSGFGLSSILGIAAADNAASQRVLLKAGFIPKGKRVMQFQGSEQTVLAFEFPGS